MGAIEKNYKFESALEIILQSNKLFYNAMVCVCVLAFLLPRVPKIGLRVVLESTVRNLERPNTVL